MHINHSNNNNNNNNHNNKTFDLVYRTWCSMGIYLHSRGLSLILYLRFVCLSEILWKFQVTPLLYCLLKQCEYVYFYDMTPQKHYHKWCKPEYTTKKKIKIFRPFLSSSYSSVSFSITRFFSRPFSFLNKFIFLKI